MLVSYVSFDHNSLLIQVRNLMLCVLELYFVILFISLLVDMGLQLAPLCT